MNSGKIVFSQLTSLFPKYEFDKVVKKFDGNYKVKEFTCWEQFLIMAFAQLTTRESLRDIENSTKAIPNRLYHMGIRSKKIAKSTLADANEKRPYQIFSQFAFALVERARKLYATEPEFQVDLDNLVYAMDSTTIDLCLNLFPWAKFRKNKGGIKMHTLLDLNGSIPTCIYLSPASLHDVNFMDVLEFQPGAFYLMDRGYFDFKRLNVVNEACAYFVIQAKRNFNYQVLSRSECTENIKADQRIRLKNRQAQLDYPGELRRVKIYDKEQGRFIVLITNNHQLNSTIIGELYRARWQVELFFKWIKQHLKIKSFFGTSFNAVAIQIWTAISVYLIISILKKEQSLKLDLNSIAQVLSLSLFEKVPLNQLFNNQELTDKESQIYKQLKIC